MKLNSIFTKISIIFLFSLTLLVVLFFFYIESDKQRINAPIVNFHKTLSQTAKENRMPPKEVIGLLKKRGFEVEKKFRQVLKSAKLIHRQRDFETLFFNESFYLHITTPRFRILFKDLNQYEKDNSIYFIFLGFFIILLLSFFWIIKSLLPLKNLKESIVEFSNGRLKVDCKIEQKDEIGELANEFDNAAKKIELLLESRQLFLRTVMHELKTPIAKGRIVSELLDDEKQSKRLISIFEKLDFLINDFAKTEQVVSKNYEINKQKYKLSEIISNANSLLMIDNIEQKLSLDIEEGKKIECDFDFLSLVFKNLIDNAFRYSEDGKVLIKQNKDEISFLSVGKKLEKPFNEYFTAFHNTTKSKNHGMGLGLYIVKSILDMHSMNFEYKYEDEKNIFIIKI